MSLNDSWFDHVRSGRKRYEGRRNFGSAKLMRIGDIVVFHHHTDSRRPTFRKVISTRQEYPTFRAALQQLPLAAVLPGVEDISAGVQVYYKFVSEGTQLRDGVVMFGLMD